MSKLGTWGDHVTLQAAADAYHVGICVVTSFLDNCVISISPIIDEQQPPDPRQITQHNQQLKQQQEQSASGPQEHAMQQLQQAPAGTQELQQIQQPASPVVDECITLWLSFWAEVSQGPGAIRLCLGGCQYPQSMFKQQMPSSAADAITACSLVLCQVMGDFGRYLRCTGCLQHAHTCCGLPACLACMTKA
jgi:hypothetical protein